MSLCICEKLIGVFNRTKLYTYQMLSLFKISYPLLGNWSLFFTLYEAISNTPVHFMNAYSLDGLAAVILLVICSCAYLKRVPRVSTWLLSEKKGFLGVFYKIALPKGVKPKHKKVRPTGPKRGHNLYIPPKKQHLIQQDKLAAEVSKVINEKNEEIIKGQADSAVGRNKTY
ncbi:hypothetical protein DICVIV_07982 [Dictyocaulus viviparus]|uniref:Protein kish-B n=1 Tax=Dictyocaulus viviparus TaxID=29172 RepID=A0A0D8XQA1_DICVI|nr:hypothetical protein DICVIV_07982 [Dictyocaulus viviparus]